MQASLWTPHPEPLLSQPPTPLSATLSDTSRSFCRHQPSSISLLWTTAVTWHLDSMPGAHAATRETTWRQITSLLYLKPLSNFSLDWKQNLNALAWLQRPPALWPCAPSCLTSGPPWPLQPCDEAAFGLSGWPCPFQTQGPKALLLPRPLPFLQVGHK